MCQLSPSFRRQATVLQLEEPSKSSCHHSRSATCCAASAWQSTAGTVYRTAYRTSMRLHDIRSRTSGGDSLIGTVATCSYTIIRRSVARCYASLSMELTANNCTVKRTHPLLCFFVYETRRGYLYQKHSHALLRFFVHELAAG